MQLGRPKGTQNGRPIQTFSGIAEPCQVNQDWLPTKKIRLLLAHPLERFL
jgi:hypothetical protein